MGMNNYTQMSEDTRAAFLNDVQTVCDKYGWDVGGYDFTDEGEHGMGTLILIKKEGDADEQDNREA